MPTIQREPRNLDLVDPFNEIRFNNEKWHLKPQSGISVNKELAKMSICLIGNLQYLSTGPKGSLVLKIGKGFFRHIPSSEGMFIT